MGRKCVESMSQAFALTGKHVETVSLNFDQSNDPVGMDNGWGMSLEGCLLFGKAKVTSQSLPIALSSLSSHALAQSLKEDIRSD